MFSVFFFNDTATTEIYTLSLHDALPICRGGGLPAGRLRLGQHGPAPELGGGAAGLGRGDASAARPGDPARDRKSTRLNSSHANISYAVFCLKKKKNEYLHTELKVYKNRS